MGWEMPWFTLTDSFDADFGVDEWHGTNVFYRDGDRVFRTYFINNRGDEQMGSTWNYLESTATSGSLSKISRQMSGLIQNSRFNPWPRRQPAGLTIDSCASSRASNREPFHFRKLCTRSMTAPRIMMSMCSRKKRVLPAFLS
jgi:Bacterial protein of unknown function (DUF899)